MLSIVRKKILTLKSALVGFQKESEAWVGAGERTLRHGREEEVTEKAGGRDNIEHVAWVLTIAFNVDVVKVIIIEPATYR